MPKNYELSVIIPARQEEWLGRTIADVLAHTSDATEIISVLDGAWPVEPLPSHPRVTLIHHSVSIGQRASMNEAARISKAKYICKMDAHVAVDQDFDQKLIQAYEPRTVVVPRLFNLHVFDWKCRRCGLRTYQGPKPTKCSACDRETDHYRKIVWRPRWNRKTDFMRFDSELKFQYWRDLGKRPGYEGPISDTLSLLGACFFMSRDFYWEMDGADEATGSWGQQGTEVACKAWLSGGRLRVNMDTWYSHLFRTQSGFGFPWPCTHGQTERARQYSQSFWREGRWSKAVRSLSSLIEQFWPVPGWTEQDLEQLKATEQGRRTQFAIAREIEKNPQHVKSAPETGLTKGIVYYTENRIREPICSAVREQLLRAVNGHQVVSVSLKPIAFGDNYVLGLGRSYETMFQQILMGLSQLDTDIAFLCEHDVLYAPEHFQFVPPRNDVYYYNENRWFISARDGRALFRYSKSTSQLCANRRLLLDHYRERIARIAKEGFGYRHGFEPGARSISHGGYDNFKAQTWFSARPNIDIRDHGSNLTRTQWRKDQFRNPKYTAGWIDSDRVPGWPGITLNRFDDWLRETRAYVPPVLV